MRWRRRKILTPERTIHRGRIWRDGSYWRYCCQTCTYGAGSNGPAFNWLIGIASKHANPDDWSRRTAL